MLKFKWWRYNLISFNVYITFGWIFCFNSIYPLFRNIFFYNVKFCNPIRFKLYLFQNDKNWLVFSMNLDSTKSLNYLKKIPEFYRDVVKCWNLSGDGQAKSPVTFIDIRKQIIWGNKYITFYNYFSI
jgi:hypothetical protein